MIAISEALTKTDPRANVLLISGSPLLHAFRMPPRIDYVKLPCLARDTRGVYGVKYLDLDYDAALRLRSSLIVSAANEFEPDVVLVDKKPLGVGGELQATLDLLSARERKPRTYLVLRDILDEPQTTQAIWEHNRYHDAIARHYSGVLVAGCVFDLAREYDFPRKTRAITEYLGYLHRENGRRSREEVRSLLNLQGLPLILVQAGGGGDGAPLLDAFIEGLRLRPAPFFTWLISGPEMDDAERKRLRASASALPNVRFDDFTDDMSSCIDAADAVVSMGGYNTVCEVLSLKKPALIVPRSKPVREQVIRAVRMTERGYVDSMLEHDLTPATLVDAATRLLNDKGSQLRARRGLAFDGLSRIAEIVCRSSPIQPALQAPTGFAGWTEPS
jgi:predicted glycosyltransferase